MNSGKNLPYEIISLINEHFITVYEVMALRHINRHWFYYKYYTIYTNKTPYTILLDRFKIVFVGSKITKYHENIIGLTLTPCSLKSNSDFLDQFKNLIYLDCHKCNTITDKKISQLTRLRYLHYSCNSNINPINIFKYLTQLECLKITCKSDICIDCSNIDNLFKYLPNLTHLSCPHYITENYINYDKHSLLKILPHINYRLSMRQIIPVKLTISPSLASIGLPVQYNNVKKIPIIRSIYATIGRKIYGILCHCGGDTYTLEEIINSNKLSKYICRDFKYSEFEIIYSMARIFIKELCITLFNTDDLSSVTIKRYWKVITDMCEYHGLHFNYHHRHIN